MALSALLRGSPPGAILAPRFAKREVSNTQIYWFLGLFGLLVLLLLIRKVVASLEAERLRKATWGHIRQICAERGLGSAVTKDLIAVLRSRRLVHPEHAVTSLRVFDTHVRAALRKRLGDEASQDVRRRLFLSPVDEARQPSLASPPPPAESRAEAAAVLAVAPARPPAGAASAAWPEVSQRGIDLQEGTEALPVGLALRLRLGKAPEIWPGGLVQVEAGGLLIALGTYGSVAPQPELGADALVSIESGEQYVFFRSRVAGISLAGLSFCRLGHAERLDRLGAGELAQVRLGQALQFFYYAPEAIGQDVTHSVRHGVACPADIRDGFLQDVSSRGVILETADTTPPLVPEAVVRFDLALPDEGRCGEVFGRVREIQPVNAGEGAPDARLYVEFLGVPPRVRDRLVHTVYEMRQREQTRRAGTAGAPGAGKE